MIAFFFLFAAFYLISKIGIPLAFNDLRVMKIKFAYVRFIL